MRFKNKVKNKVKNNDYRPTPGKLFADEIVCVDVVVAFDFAVAFDLHPLLTTPIVQDRNGIKRCRCLSEASFCISPFLSCTIGNPKGVGCAVAFFCLLFLAKQEK